MSIGHISSHATCPLLPSSFLHRCGQFFYDFMILLMLLSLPLSLSYNHSPVSGAGLWGNQNVASPRLKMRFRLREMMERWHLRRPVALLQSRKFQCGHTKPLGTIPSLSRVVAESCLRGNSNHHHQNHPRSALLGPPIPRPSPPFHKRRIGQAVGGRRRP